MKTSTFAFLSPAPRQRSSTAVTKLAQLRTARGLSQSEMADLTGISTASYWRLEHDELPSLPLRYLSNCALVLGVALEDLIEDEWREWKVFDERRREPHDPASQG